MADESAVLLDGPWRHRGVNAGGTRFHVVEQGDGPLVLLVHGFPEFWWSWHRQLESLAAAGYRAAAVDLRGYGGSDKPPRGYDLATLANDLAGLVRSLGEANATVVGHDWGGLLAWTMGVYYPKVVQRLVAVSAAHPLRLGHSLLTDVRGQGWAVRHALGFQLPIAPEKRLVKNDAALIGELLNDWSGPGWPDAETERLYRSAFQIPGVAHCALEYHRWTVRSLLRPDGIRYAGPDARADPGAGAASARRARPVCAAAQRAGLGPLRRGAVPLEADRGRRALPARGAPVLLRRGAHRLAVRPRARPVSGTRDRDESGRARNARPRDAYGRPLARVAEGEERVPEDYAPSPAEALAEAQRLLDADRPFHAHEVLEAAWKSAPEAERELWQGLAQLAVGFTHVRRGNAKGAQSLLRRAADRLAAHDRPPHAIAAAALAARARELADRIEGDGLGAVTDADLAPRLTG